MKQDSLKFLLGILLLLFVDELHADSLNQWAWRFPVTTGRSLYAVTYGGGQFVAVGADGMILSSPDAYSWTVQNSGVSSKLAGVAYADGEYAAVGDGGITLVSSNAVAWTQLPFATSNSLHGIAGDSSWRTDGLPRFVAVGDLGTAVVCTNGTNWSVVSPGTSNTLYAVSRSGSLYVMVGNAGTIIIKTATGGFTHLPQLFVGTIYNLYTVAAAGNGAVAAGGDLNNDPFSYPAHATNQILYSVNSGVRWANQSWVDGSDQFGNPLWNLSEMFILTGMAYGTNGFVGVGYTGYCLEYHPAVVLTSKTGSTWTELPPGVCENGLNGITYGKGLYVAVGDYGSISVSADATNWTEAIPDRRGSIVAIACNTNLCIASSMPIWYSWGFPDSRTLVSTNGVNWTVSSTAYNMPVITDLACSDSQFVGVSGTSIYTTIDGFHWQNIGGFTNTLSGVRYLNGQFIAVGANGAIYTSIDGTNWSNNSVATTGTFNGLAYGNGLYMAGGSVTATSSDGSTWTLCPSNPPATISRMVFGNGLFVATAFSGYLSSYPGDFTYGPILTSTDGVVWQPQSGPGGTGIAYNGGIFLAIGDRGFISESTDGMNWQSISPLPWDFWFTEGYWWIVRYYSTIYPSSYCAISAYKNTFLAGGMEGMLMQSGNAWSPATISSPQKSPAGITFSYNQQVDVPYRIQASTNLVNWQTVSTGMGSGQPATFFHPTSADCRAQFYRIVSP